PEPGVLGAAFESAHGIACDRARPGHHHRATDAPCWCRGIDLSAGAPKPRRGTGRAHVGPREVLPRAGRRGRDCAIGTGCQRQQGLTRLAVRDPQDEREVMRHAKIVATWGPAVASYDHTLDLIRAGVNVARLNMSH